MKQQKKPRLFIVDAIKVGGRNSKHCGDLHDREVIGAVSIIFVLVHSCAGGSRINP